MLERPGLRLKERVRNGELSPQAALNLLRQTDPLMADKTKTADWLKKRKAY